MARSVTAVLVVSTLIFVPGIVLVKEALRDTCHRMGKPECITFVGILVAMTVRDFDVGVLLESSLAVSTKQKFPGAYTHASFNVN